MSLYQKIITINPISPWISGLDYFIGQQVSNGGLFFQCNADNTASGANEPPNVSFWDEIFPVDPNVIISDFVETVLDAEVGSGEVRSNSLRINADRGAFITDRNTFGVDLNPIAMELGQVSLWLNCIHEGDFIPWFGDQLFAGNSLRYKQRGGQTYGSIKRFGRWDPG